MKQTLIQISEYVIIIVIWFALVVFIADSRAPDNRPSSYEISNEIPSPY